VRHDRSVSAGSDGSSLVPALAITGAVLVVAAAVFAFRRKHV
jgi:LPXTG-motif cell wall-anchored protein